MRKGFYITSESWWHSEFEDDIIENIMIGDYPEDGGTNGEFNVVFYSYINGPHLQIFSDAFHVANQLADFQEFLFDPKNEKISRDDFIDGLKKMCYIDLTEREVPERHLQ